MGLKIIGYVAKDFAVNGEEKNIPVLFDKDHGKNDDGIVFIKNHKFFHEIGALGVYANVDDFIWYAENAGWFKRA